MKGHPIIGALGPDSDVPIRYQYTLPSQGHASTGRCLYCLSRCPAVRPATAHVRMVSNFQTTTQSNWCSLLLPDNSKRFTPVAVRIKVWIYLEFGYQHRQRAKTVHG